MNVDTELRRRDAARDVPADLAGSPRARATLVAIVDGEPPRRPAGRRLARPLWALAATALVVAAVLVGANLVIGGGTAEASWSATPQLADPGVTAHWGKRCITQLDRDEETRHPWRIRLVEQRGRWAYAVVTAAGGHQAGCLFDTSHRDAGGSYSWDRLERSPAPESMVTGGVNSTWNDNGTGAYTVFGWVGSDVASVDVVLPRNVVHATVDHGYVAAWWPGRIPPAPTPSGSVTTLKDAKKQLEWVAKHQSQANDNPRVRITAQDGTVRTGHMNDFRS